MWLIFTYGTPYGRSTYSKPAHVSGSWYGRSRHPIGIPGVTNDKMSLNKSLKGEILLTYYEWRYFVLMIAFIYGSGGIINEEKNVEKEKEGNRGKRGGERKWKKKEKKERE